jgi:hypothetical protein
MPCGLQLENRGHFPKFGHETAEDMTDDAKGLDSFVNNNFF